MIGDVVGGAHEFIEGENGRAMARMDEPRGHGKILVPMALARSRFGGIDHHPSATLACTRPFHLPPCPRIYCRAESIVKSVYCRAIRGSARPHSGESR